MSHVVPTFRVRFVPNLLLARSHASLQTSTSNSFTLATPNIYSGTNPTIIGRVPLFNDDLRVHGNTVSVVSGIVGESEG